MEFSTEQLTDIFKLAKGIYQTHKLDVSRMDTNSIVVKQGHTLYHLSIIECTDSDVRIEGGYTIIFEESRIKDNYIVSEDGMKVEQSWYSDKQLIVPKNINLIVNYINSLK